MYGKVSCALLFCSKSDSFSREERKRKREKNGKTHIDPFFSLDRTETLETFTNLSGSRGSPYYHRNTVNNTILPLYADTYTTLAIIVITVKYTGFFVFVLFSAAGLLCFLDK